MHRRELLKGAATAAVLSVGGSSWFAYERGVFSVGDGPAYAPWKDWRNGTGHGPAALVRAALLAASPHNTQPWRYKVTDSSVELHLDRRRNVGPLDPYLREEQIGMGCALENLILAAPANGYAATASLAPGELIANSGTAESELVARVELTPCTPVETELYRAIPRRHTNRSLYDRRRPIAPSIVEELRRLPHADERVRLFLFTGEADRSRIVQLSSEANNRLYSDPEVEAASERWIRLRWDEVQRYRDGLTVDAFGLPAVTSAAAKIMPTSLLRRMVSKGQKEGYAERMMAAPLIGLIAVKNRYDREQCLQAGRLWQRIHLFATSRGIAGRPGNEAMEMIDYERMQGKPPGFLSELGKITGEPEWQPTFAFLLGYPTLTAAASPRRPLQGVLTV